MDANEYFKPTALRAVIDRAALIVALVDNRESATRTDYAHTRIKDIIEILNQVRDGRSQNGATDLCHVVPSQMG